jgi:dihydrofolate reductase
MFGPQRGPWPNEDWKGWWGPNPPYHHPVFVLSHHKHSSFEMEGGTSFSFVNDGIESALKQAFAAAKGKEDFLTSPNMRTRRPGPGRVE